MKKSIVITFENEQALDYFRAYKERAEENNGTVTGLTAGLACSAIRDASLSLLEDASPSFTTLEFFAGMTPNGNARRCFVTYERGAIVAVYKDSGRGRMDIANPQHRAALHDRRIITTPAQMRELLNYWK